MIFDSWFVSTHLAYGIVVAINDVRAVYAESSQSGSTTNEDVSKAKSDGNNEDPSPIEDEIKLFLLQQAGEGYKIYNIGNVFALIMQKHDLLNDVVGLDLDGPYEIKDDACGLFIDVLYGGVRMVDVDSNLVGIARSLTPAGRGLRFGPGNCLLRCNNGMMAHLIHEIVHPSQENLESWVHSQKQESSVPSDLTIVIGSGDEERSYSFNRAALAFYLPELVRLVDAQGSKANDVTDGDNPIATLNLPDIAVDAFDHAVDHFAAFGSSPAYNEYKTEKEFLGMLGVLNDDKRSPKKKKACVEEDEKVKKNNHNVTFLVGPDKTPVTAQREVLAIANPVMCRILYGLDRSNPNRPDIIKWPEFDAVAVEKALEALEHRKVPTSAPFDLRCNEVAMLDYLGETESSVSMEYDEIPRWSTGVKPFMYEGITPTAFFGRTTGDPFLVHPKGEHL